MRTGAIHLIGFLLSLATSVLAGLLGAVLYVRSQEPPPRIVIMDLRLLAQRVVQDPTLDDAGRQRRTQEVSGAVNRAVEAYARRGVIVLDSAAVLRAPKEDYVQP